MPLKTFSELLELKRISKLLHNPTSVGFGWRIIWRTCCLFVHVDIPDLLLDQAWPIGELYIPISLPRCSTDCLPWAVFQLDWITLWETVVRNTLWHLLWGIIRHCLPSSEGSVWSPNLGSGFCCFYANRNILSPWEV